LLTNIKAIHAEVKGEYRWPNAPTESLWGKLKVSRLYGRALVHKPQTTDEVIDWLNFYNAKRSHATLGYVSPMQFELNWIAAQTRQAA